MYKQAKKHQGKIEIGNTYGRVITQICSMQIFVVHVLKVARGRGKPLLPILGRTELAVREH